MMCLCPGLWASYVKKCEKYFLASLKSMKKEVGSGVGSGSISQRYGSGDPDPHQNVTDPQHCLQFLIVEVPNGQRISCLDSS
jgi:hypothetical protein